MYKSLLGFLYHGESLVSDNSYSHLKIPLQDDLTSFCILKKNGGIRQQVSTEPVSFLRIRLGGPLLSPSIPSLCGGPFRR
jgi:hypothetical protein